MEVQMAFVPEHIFRNIYGIADTELTDEFVMSIGHAFEHGCLSEE